MKEKIENLEWEFKKDYQEITTSGELELLKVKYLGRKSLLNQLFSEVSNLSREEKADLGRNLNSLKQRITSLIQEKFKGFEEGEEKIDLTFPSEVFELGSRHILTTVTEKICSIFQELGFMVIEGGETEDEWHNFTALNIPLEHPSRDVFDTFYLDIPEQDRKRYLLRSHTSCSQIRVMQEEKPPLAVISSGRVYRPDETDASHSFMFHQLEGFAVDRDINFAQLKGVLLYFAQKFFSANVALRFRPHYFPFTEPSAEVDVSCIICKNQKSKIKNQKCGVCRGKGWLEVLGCGMIHPTVLEACGISSKKYRGFAFGMGIERMTMLKYGISDIRLFFDNDTRFLKQF